MFYGAVIIILTPKRDKGVYKIRPYKGFRCACRGEPRVHPTFSDSFLEYNTEPAT
jgi:hypothetical protein